MAWQNSAAMVGNGGVSGGSSEAGGSNGQSQGTEYTLQGMESLGGLMCKAGCLGGDFEDGGLLGRSYQV